MSRVLWGWLRGLPGKHSPIHFVLCQRTAGARRKLTATRRDCAVVRSLTCPLLLHPRAGEREQLFHFPAVGPTRVLNLSRQFAQDFLAVILSSLPIVSPVPCAGLGLCPWTTSPSAEDVFRPCVRHPFTRGRTPVWFSHLTTPPCFPEVPSLRPHSVPGSMPWPFPPARLFNRPGHAESATYPLCPSAPSPTGSGSIDPVLSCVKHSVSKANIVLSSCSGFLPPWWWPRHPPSCSSSRWVSLLQPGSDHRTRPSRTSILARLAEFISEGLGLTPYSRHTSGVASLLFFIFEFYPELCWCEPSTDLPGPAW